MTESILHLCVLGAVQLLRSSAQLSPEVALERRGDARVELKLTPLPATPTAGQSAWVMRAELHCRGVQRGDATAPPWFEIVIAVNASYQPAPGALIDFERFARGHMSLARQIYPLLQQRCQQLMADLGLQQIRLPLDFIAQPGAGDAEASQNSVRVH